MAFFEWKEQYSVGIPSIDEQHQQLFALISNFYDQIRQKQAKQAIHDVLVGLVDYARTHFLTEETYFKRYNYPRYAMHVAKHTEFIDRLMEFQARFQANELLLPIEIADFMKTWLTQHVLGEDQRYAPFLKTHLAQTSPQA